MKLIEAFSDVGLDQKFINPAYIIVAEVWRRGDFNTRITVDLEKEYGSCSHDRPRHTYFYLKISLDELRAYLTA